VSGLAGTGLALQATGFGSVTVGANGSFTLPTAAQTGTAYAVTVGTQPTNPAQTCTLTNASGTLAAANVTNVAVTCTTNTFTVGGTVSGLAGTGLALTSTGAGTVTVNANGNFTLPTSLTPGTAYNVSVTTQPSAPAQTCVVTNATGTIGSANVTNITVSCATTTYSVGGTVSGLAGAGLTLQSAGAGSVTVNANGSFTLPTGLPPGAPYAVAITAQPSSPTQTCSVTNAAGNMGSANVTNVAVTCSTLNFTLGGSVTGLAGSGLTIRSNGVNLPISANGAFVFAAPLASGTAYNVTVPSQPVTPHQTCSVANASGTIGGANVSNVAVTCATNLYSVRGTASGLVGSGLTLTVNGGNSLLVSNNGAFEFTNAVASGASFTVAVSVQPATPAQTCILYNATGSVTNAHAEGVQLACGTSGARFAYVPVTGGMHCYVINGVSRVLVPLPTARCDTNATTIAFAVAPNGQYGYATTGGNQIVPYTIAQSTGALTRVTSGARATGTNPAALAIHPAGTYVYTANYNADTISVFAVDVATGSLTQVGTAVATGDAPYSIAIDRSGRYLYTANSNTSNVSGFLINPTTGALSAMSGSPFAASSTPRGLALDLQNRFAYVAANGTDRLHGYTMNSTTGALTQVAGSPAVTGDGPVEVVVDSTGSYAYVINSNAASISAFSLNPTTGVMVPVAGAPFARPGAYMLTAHPSAGFVYVSNSNVGTISTFSIDGVGALTEVGTAVDASAPTAGTFHLAIAP
jgi:6-phosphogluconolactonase (cycloisomerase 2 family)